MCEERKERSGGEIARVATRKTKRRSKSVLGCTRLGCPACGVRVCDSCWPTYNHDLRPSSVITDNMNIIPVKQFFKFQVLLSLLANLIILWPSVAVPGKGLSPR